MEEPNLPPTIQAPQVANHENAQNLKPIQESQGPSNPVIQNPISNDVLAPIHCETTKNDQHNHAILKNGASVDQAANVNLHSIETQPTPELKPIISEVQKPLEIHENHVHIQPISNDKNDFQPNQAPLLEPKIDVSTSRNITNNVSWFETDATTFEKASEAPTVPFSETTIKLANESPKEPEHNFMNTAPVAEKLPEEPPKEIQATETPKIVHTEPSFISDSKIILKAEELEPGTSQVIKEAKSIEDKHEQEKALAEHTFGNTRNPANLKVSFNPKTNPIQYTVSGRIEDRNFEFTWPFQEFCKLQELLEEDYFDHIIPVFPTKEVSADGNLDNGQPEQRVILITNYLTKLFELEGLKGYEKFQSFLFNSEEWKKIETKGGQKSMKWFDYASKSVQRLKQSIIGSKTVSKEFPEEELKLNTLSEVVVSMIELLGNFHNIQSNLRVSERNFSKMMRLVNKKDIDKAENETRPYLVPILIKLFEGLSYDLLSCKTALQRKEEVLNEYEQAFKDIQKYDTYQSEKNPAIEKKFELHKVLKTKNERFNAKLKPSLETQIARITNELNICMKKKLPEIFMTSFEQMNKNN